MHLYKYRSLRDLNYVLDILVHSRLHCARYWELNDPFEGLFHTVFYTTPEERAKSPFFPAAFTVTKSINNLPNPKEVRICSLSSSLSDVRLWSNYADGNRGIALEIDFSGLENFVHEVIYSKELPTHGYTILTSPSPMDVLTCKTVHWSYESEYRIIHGEEYFDIKGRLKSIYAGERIDKTHLAFLDKMKQSDIPIIHTEIDSKNIEVKIKSNVNWTPKIPIYSKE